MPLRNNVLILKIFLIWSLSNLERTTAVKTSLEKRIRAVSNFITLAAFHSIFLTLGKFSVESILKDWYKYRKRKEVSRPSHAKTAKKCTKKPDHVQSCCFANLARDFFLSVAVVVALYKFPNILECPHEVHGRTQFSFGQSQFSIRLTCTQRFW